MTRFCLCFFTPPSTAPSVPPLLSHSRPVFFKQLQSWLQLTHEAKSPRFPPARPTVAQPTSSANPFRTACLSVSARGRQKAWSSMHTSFPRQRDQVSHRKPLPPLPPHLSYLRNTTVFISCFAYLGVIILLIYQSHDLIF